MSGRRLSITAIAVSLLMPVAKAAQDPPAASPRFKSSVSIVSVSAVVRDQKGRFVRDLAQKDFRVAEAGRDKRILDFRAQSDGPVKLGLLFDASGSMRVGRRAVDAQQAARHFIAALRGKDEAGIFSFDTQLDRVKEFTSDAAALEAALEKVNRPFGQTSLYDAIAKAAQVVAAHGRGEGKLPHRTALVVLTDGIDTKSQMTTAQVTAIASGIDVPVYVLAVMQAIDDPAVDETPAFDESALRDLAVNTGGDLFVATAPAHASIAARRIIEELRHQYVLAFEAGSGEGWRTVEVRTRNPKLIVRARTGYSAGTGRLSEDARYSTQPVLSSGRTDVLTRRINRGRSGAQASEGR